MAIAYDNSAVAQTGSSSSLSASFTTAGADRLLFVGIWCGNANVASVTYNGVAMSLLAQPTGGNISSFERFYVYYLVNPASGANNVVINLSGAVSIGAIFASYNGVNQTNPIIENTAVENNLETGTSYSESITTYTDGAFGVWYTREYNGRTISSGANTAYRQKESTQFGLILADSGSPIGTAGTYAMNLSANASGNWVGDVLASLVPASAKLSTTSGSFLLSGINAALNATRKVPPASGVFTLSGQPIQLRRAMKIVAGSGSFTLTAQDSQIYKTFSMSASAGSFTLTGQTVIFICSHRIVTASGNFTLTGYSTALTAGKTIQAATGSFALAGQAAVLVVGKSLSAAAGSFSFIGQALALVYARRIIASSRSFSFTGQAALLSRSRALAAASGSFILSGQYAELSHDYASPLWINDAIPGGSWQAGQVGITAGQDLFDGFIVLAGSLGEATVWAVSSHDEYPTASDWWPDAVAGGTWYAGQPVLTSGQILFDGLEVGAGQLGSVSEWIMDSV